MKKRKKGCFEVEVQLMLLCDDTPPSTKRRSAAGSRERAEGNMDERE
jgi:hypothetical protein